jgi:hypothetical protein
MVDKKNVKKGILKWPHVIPAKSNKGLGIEARRRIVMKPCFCKWLKKKSLTFSSRVNSVLF